MLYYAYPDHNNYLSISSCFLKQRAKYIHMNTGLNEFYYLSNTLPKTWKSGMIIMPTLKIFSSLPPLKLYMQHTSMCSLYHVNLSQVDLHECVIVSQRGWNYGSIHVFSKMFIIWSYHTRSKLPAKHAVFTTKFELWWNTNYTAYRILIFKMIPSTVQTS